MDFRFNIIGPYGIVLCCYQKRFSFSLKIFLWYPCSFLVIWDITSLLSEIFSFAISVSLFLLFSNFSAAVSNLFFVLVNKVFELLYDASMHCWVLMTPLISSFLDTLLMTYFECNAFCMVNNFLSFGPFAWVPHWSILKMLPRCLSLWWDFYCRACLREVFSLFRGTFVI